MIIIQKSGFEGISLLNRSLLNTFAENSEKITILSSPEIRFLFLFSLLSYCVNISVTAL